MTPLRALAAVAAALAIAVLLAHAWASVTSGYDVNLVSGVWLALAVDLRDGVFYRDLIGPMGYGGTRYFPLVFVLAAGLMALGLEPLTAGHIVSVGALAVLLSGVLVLLRRLGLSPSDAFPAAVFSSVAPYFTQQSAYAIRADPLATGLAAWGLACAVGALRRPPRWGIVGLAALWFALAIAAKPTAVYAPLAASMWLSFAGRWTHARRLALLTGCGVLLLIAATEWLSEGRFLVSLRATALAGRAPSELLSRELVLRPLTLVGSSHLLTVVVGLAAAVIVASRPRWFQLPPLVLVSAAATTALALATPGTIAANQMTDLYVAAAVFLCWVGYTRPGAAPVATGLVILLLAWTAWQNIGRLAEIRGSGDARRLSARQAALAPAWQECHGPVLAESPLVPILAGIRPILLDPFAFKTVAGSVPVDRALIEELSARRFSCVVLEHDPTETRGAAWYRNVHFGAPVIEAVLQNYEYRQSAGGQRFYEAIR